VLLLIFLVLLLVLYQSGLPAQYLTRQVGVEAQIGPRDDLPEPTIEIARARRAFNNLQETLPIFLTLAVLSIIYQESGWLSLLGAGLYFVARVVHFLCYMRGLTPWRSIAFGFSMLGIFITAVPIIPHLWS
jgi:uncharacterized MAPEG superfamily protein